MDYLPQPKQREQLHQGERNRKKLEDGSVQKAIGEIYFTYEYEARGDFLIQEIFEPNHTVYIMPPGPCDGGDNIPLYIIGRESHNVHVEQSFSHHFNIYQKVIHGYF